MHDDIFTKGSRGQFRGDFSRDTFDPKRHYSRVLMQQGRVQLDADWNEQASIFTNYLRTLCSDLIGPHGVPPSANGKDWPGFALTANNKTLNISAGHYYVDGILCVNETDTDFFEQPNLNPTPLEAGNYLLYLDVWERHVSFIEDDYMREKALLGPDTATRAQIVWQVKALPLERDGETERDYKLNHDIFLETLNSISQPGNGLLRARAKREQPEKIPCLISPESKYRGAENQLYRVEIHHPSIPAKNQKATYKWSRENGSVIYGITRQNAERISVEHLGLDHRFSLQPNDWVEILDDEIILANKVGKLLKVEAIDNENSEVILQAPPEFEVDLEKHPYLRRWDHRAGASEGIEIIENGTIDEAGNDWLLLEDGIEIQFPTATTDADGNLTPNVYQSGDYWLIPARTATGDVEWPGPVDKPTALPPQGVEHHYAPLWRINVANTGRITAPAGNDLRRKITAIWS